MSPTQPPRPLCPPNLCDCSWEALCAAAEGDRRILLLSNLEERRLLERLERIDSLADLERMAQRMEQQLGIRVEIAPGFNEVRTMRGIEIQVAELPGLCRKTRQAIRKAIRRGLENTPQIAFDLLNANDLLRDA